MMPYVKLDMGKYIKGLPQPEGYFDASAHKEAYSDSITSDEWGEKLNELWDFLKNGELPEGVRCNISKLSLQTAKNIMWFLQEITKVIPDSFSVCSDCEEIMSEGYLYYSETNGKFYCDDCINYAPVCRCEWCANEAGYKSSAYSQEHDMFLCKDCKEEKKRK